MNTVGVRELKNRLSEYLRRVYTGERLVVTEHGRPVAVISPARTPSDQKIETMIRERVIRWSGGKPKGATRPPRIKGASVGQAVIEGRR